MIARPFQANLVSLPSLVSLPRHKHPSWRSQPSNEVSVPVVTKRLNKKTTSPDRQTGQLQGQKQTAPASTPVKKPAKKIEESGQKEKGCVVHHEASRQQYLVRITGFGSKQFSYKHTYATPEAALAAANEFVDQKSSA